MHNFSEGRDEDSTERAKGGRNCQKHCNFMIIFQLLFPFKDINNDLVGPRWQPEAATINKYRVIMEDNIIISTFFQLTHYVAVRALSRQLHHFPVKCHAN